MNHKEVNMEYEEKFTKELHNLKLNRALEEYSRQTSYNQSLLDTIYCSKVFAKVYSYDVDVVNKVIKHTTILSDLDFYIRNKAKVVNIKRKTYLKDKRDYI